MAASAPVQIPLDRAPEEMLQYLASYKVVVCAECKYAVQPSAISGHLKDIHRIRHSLRRPFMQYVAKLDLVSPETVLNAEIVKFPVPGLLVRNGLKCSSDHCSHLCASEKRMKTHWYSVHGRPGRPFVDWHPVPLQTFFRGNLHRYFTHSSSDLSTTGHVCHLTQNSAREDGVPEEPHIRGPIPVSISEPLSHAMLDDSDSHLLQHYISSTSLTLAWNLETKVIWQDIVPQLAQQNPFLMHGILACAGLHLAYLYPAQERQYSIAAGIHQDIAMPLFRSVIANVDTNNCHATLVFSHLLVIYSWASEKQDSRLLLVEAEGDDLLPPWLYFIRSGCSLLCKVWDCLEGGPIKALVNAWGIPIKAPQSKTELVIHLLSAIPEESSPDAWLAEECKIYHDAAVELGTAFASTPLSTNYTTWDTLRIWPMYTKMEFFELLRTWHPGVLILLAHYYILLKKIEEHWYFEGRAKPLLSTVWRRLEPKWHQYIAWPLQEIGVNPTIP